MVKIVSFNLEGDYAAFRDPSITTNQTVYVIPSKSAVIGLICGMLGIRRPNTLDSYGPGIIYNDLYLEVLKKTKIGIKVNGGTKKISFFTNHRSLKEGKTKPFKTELLLSPKYTIYVKSNEDLLKHLSERLLINDFEFVPTLGHSYCFGRVSGLSEYDLTKASPYDIYTNTVILDETSETHDKGQSVKFHLKDLRVIVERHLHHYYDDGTFERKVLRHWIPVPEHGTASSLFIESYAPSLNLVEFYQLSGEQTICVY